MSRLSLTNISGAVFFLLGRATVTNDPIRVPDMVIGPMCEICLVATLASTKKKCDPGDIKVLPAPNYLWKDSHESKWTLVQNSSPDKLAPGSI